MLASLSVHSEAEETRRCDDLASALGYEVARLEQRRASRLKLGLPDRYYRHRARGVTIWWESKRASGKLTREQHEFLVGELEAGRNLAACGTATEFRAVLELVARGATQGMARERCQTIVGLYAERGYR